MGRTGKVLYGSWSYAVDFVCTTCRNEPFGMDGCRSFVYMCIRNTCFLGNMVERSGAEIQEDNDNRFGDWGISVDNDSHTYSGASAEANRRISHRNTLRAACPDNHTYRIHSARQEK